MEQLWGKTVEKVDGESCWLVFVCIVGRWGKLKGGDYRMMGDCNCNVLCTEPLAIKRCGHRNLLQTKLNGACMRWVVCWGSYSSLCWWKGLVNGVSSGVWSRQRDSCVQKLPLETLKTLIFISMLVTHTWRATVGPCPSSTKSIDRKCWRRGRSAERFVLINS